VLKWNIVAGTLLKLCLLGISPAQSVPDSSDEQRFESIQKSDQVWFGTEEQLVEGETRSTFSQAEVNPPQATWLSSVETPDFPIDPAILAVSAELETSQPPLNSTSESTEVANQTSASNLEPPQTTNQPTESTIAQASPNHLDVKPEVIQESPVLQRWQQKIPNVLQDIRSDPSFRTRLRLGYADFSEAGAGWLVGIEDVFIGQTHLTLSGDYQASFDGEQQTWGVDGRYYLRPLGRYFNLAPVVGYRRLENDRDTAEGIHLGLRFLFVLSRTGAAEIAFTPSWIAPGSNEEAGLTTLSFGYAVTRNLRLSTEFQKQNTRRSKDSRIGVIFEWMF
jgi:hypothetical protein